MLGGLEQEDRESGEYKALSQELKDLALIFYHQIILWQRGMVGEFEIGVCYLLIG